MSKNKAKLIYARTYLEEQLESEKFEKEHWQNKYKKLSKENTKWIIATGAFALLNVLQVFI